MLMLVTNIDKDKKIRALMVNFILSIQVDIFHLFDVAWSNILNI